MMSKYSKNYFTERDILIPQLALTIEALLKKNNLKTVLDVGCGSGKLINYLMKKGFEVAGVDFSNEAIKLAKKNNPYVKIKMQQAESLKFKENSFDAICAISLIEHLKKNQAKKFIKISRKILKKKGLVFLVTPNFASPTRFLFGKKWFAYQDKTHISFYTPREIEKLLRKHGFKDIKFTFSINKDFDFDWGLKKIKKLPKKARLFINFVLISTFLAKFRDSIWIAARK